eukprot:COSAG02_NODE_1772_length_10984_cov_8.166651_7_plen_104_part_00
MPGCSSVPGCWESIGWGGPGGAAPAAGTVGCSSVPFRSRLVTSTPVQRGHGATNRHGQKLQQVLAFTECTEEVALDCLDATSGDVEQASILALDAVGREERKR